MKKCFALFLAALILLTGCAEKKNKVVTVTLCADGWEDGIALQELLDRFHETHPDIVVTLSGQPVEPELAETTEAAVPHQLLLCNLFDPEVSRSSGDLSALWTGDSAPDFHPEVLPLCTDGERYTFYPFRVLPFCMGINIDLFVQTGAIQYIDTDKRTWTAEDLEQAVRCLYEAGYQEIGLIPCVGIPQDHSTRALVSNLSGGSLIRDAASACNGETTRALQLLAALPGIRFDTGTDGNGEAFLFATGTHALSFCWDPSTAAAYAERTEFDVFPMAFPTQGNAPRLYGDIWGFRLISDEDEEKQAAAMTFLQWLAGSTAAATEYDALTSYIVAPVPGEDDFRGDWQQLLTDISAGIDPAIAISDLAGRIR